MAKAKANYKIKGTEIIAEIAKLTPEEIQEIKNYMAFGYTLVDKKTTKKKTKSKTIAEMRAELKEAPEILKKFNEAYETKAPKGNKDFKQTGFGKACDIYNDWVKNKKKAAANEETTEKAAEE